MGRQQVWPPAGAANSWAAYDLSAALSKAVSVPSCEVLQYMLAGRFVQGGSSPQNIFAKPNNKVSGTKCMLGSTYILNGGAAGGSTFAVNGSGLVVARGWQDSGTAIHAEGSLPVAPRSTKRVYLGKSISVSGNGSDSQERMEFTGYFGDSTLTADEEITQYVFAFGLQFTGKLFLRPVG